VRVLKPVPEDLADIVGDAVCNLRSALDYAAYAIATPTKPGTRNAAFPFAQNSDELERSIRKRSRDVPPGIVALFRSFQPYGGGNPILHTLNRMCNQDKHCTLIPMAESIGAANIDRALDGDSDRPRRWDSSNNEITFGAVGKGSQSDYSLNIILNNLGELTLDWDVVRNRSHSCSVPLR
jgi:hypothetical protein